VAFLSLGMTTEMPTILFCQNKSVRNEVFPAVVIIFPINDKDHDQKNEHRRVQVNSSLVVLVFHSLTALNFDDYVMVR
jgi:hypothetical protein